MRFRILGSSSAGNSALICTEKCKVLLDAGFTGKRMEGLLEQAGVALEQIDAIFITHEHSDHITGLRGLTRRQPDIRVFANATTARVVQERLPRQLNWQIFENGLPFTFADLTVSPFSIPHDAYDPVGYHICQRDEGAGNAASTVTGDAGSSATGSITGSNTGLSICWLTDLGYVTAAARRHAAECDLLVVEANHDPDMLERCETRSWSTKQRIRGRHGHLSNQAAYELLAAIENPCWQHICLAHISAECNSLEIVEKQFAPLRNGTRSLDIHIFDPASPAPGAEFDLRKKQAVAQEPEPTAAPTAEPDTATDATPQLQSKAEAVSSTRAKEKAADKSSSQVRISRVTQIEIALNF